MRELDRTEAYDLLMEASKMNPGKWIEHSINVAKITEKLADKLGLDKNKAYVYGLLHDIGRREGITGTRHIIDGYNYLQELGYEDVSRYCLTHSYFIKDVTYIYGKSDMSEEEVKFVQNYLDNVEYNLYDKLVQIGDCMGLPDGITYIERRLIDVHLRHGVNHMTVNNWKAIFKLQNEIEDNLGYSIYKVFPEIEKEISNKLIKDILTF